ncbi:MAG: fibronectin type III domain-containing protein, partial [Prolixibacteraceae bacterium]|nr:fibronectin type III domain-containing protein [Prolixibacteraceae bacterium]MBN2774538.1 fibronectin type III domain-containing protein [Prolixibacteraceae bacterium]
MRKFFVLLMSIMLMAGFICTGQSNIGISPSGYLTSLPPEIPSLVSPSDLATDQPVAMELTWQSQIHTAYFSLEVSTESDFSSLIVDLSSLADTTYSLSGLENNATYYWRVSATNVAGTSELSTARGFTTIVALPE